MHPRIENYSHYQQQPQPQQQQQQPPQGAAQRVLYVTRRPEPRQEQDMERIVIVIDDEVIKLFTRQVYFIAMIFILATSITWLAMSGAEFNFQEAVPVPYFAWIIIAFFLLMIMNCIPQVRYFFPVNWVLTIVIVIMTIFAGACIIDNFDVLVLLMGLGIAMAVVVIFYSCGALCSQRFLPGILCTACMSCLLCISLLVFIILIIFLRNPIIGLVFAILLLLLVVVMMPFEAQYIHGRLEIVPLNDALHCSLTIYFHFVVLVYSIGYFFFYCEEQNK